mmetsp:Transcript_41479/g.54578  ORF Transcript_41479/g.54578 Transcript_41479/m.54578 type:complete len:433 (-) Transcript_41479:6-1304(-)
MRNIPLKSRTIAEDAEVALSNRWSSWTSSLRCIEPAEVSRCTLALMLTLCFNTSAQMDTSLQLISKVDFQPQYELHDGKIIGLMGYTKTLSAPINIPAPTLTFEEGDSVNLSFWNLSQGAPHTIHLHGLDVDQANDGVPHLSFEVEHDEIGNYYFKAPHPGTYLYHCHVTSVLHVQGGMYGLMIIKPKSNPNLTWENGYQFDSENAWLFSEVDTNWHHDSIINHPHDPLATTHTILPYSPQHFVVNGKSEAQLSAMPLVASVGEKVYMRLANIGYFGNRVIFPAGMNAEVISSDGRPLPNTFSSDTIDVYPGERFGVMLEANSEFNDVVQVQYVDMNTHQVANTQEVDLTVSGFVGLDETVDQSFYAYPNPAATSVKLPLSGTWYATDLSGRQAQKIQSSGKTFNITSLKEGTYLLKHYDLPQKTIKLTVIR